MVLWHKIKATRAVRVVCVGFSLKFHQEKMDEVVCINPLYGHEHYTSDFTVNIYRSDLKIYQPLTTIFVWMPWQGRVLIEWKLQNEKQILKGALGLGLVTLKTRSCGHANFLSSHAASQVVVTTTCGAASDDKVGIMITLGFQWMYIHPGVGSPFV